jgi:3-hydroxy acid dehydrogenase/malonic semialdehyde reductase
MDNLFYTLITGASSGIGEATARLLAKKGHNLILVARRAERLHALCEQLIENHQIAALPYAVDLNDLTALEDFFKQIQDFNIQTLVNNAGLALGKSSMELYDWEDFNQMIDTNIKAFTRVAQLSIPFLLKTQGHMINISSIAGLEAYEGGSVYCASKAYVKMISKSLRLDLAGTGIRITDIAPGAVETEFSLVRFKGQESTANAVYDGFVPLSALDIAEAIVFALDRPAHVNIETMLIMPTAQAGATRIVRK